MVQKKLYKSRENKILAGIFGGLGEYFVVDPVLLRLIFLIILVFTGFIPGFIIYLIAFIIIPKKPA